MSLNKKNCVACSGEIPPLNQIEILEFLKELDPSWECINNHHLEINFKLKDFVTALEMTNKIGMLAEEENHHPDLHLSWGKVKVVIFTHKINGSLKMILFWLLKLIC